MEEKQLVAVDLGNTFVKIGYFKNNELASVERVSWDKIMNDTPLQNKLIKCAGIFASVLSNEQNKAFKDRFSSLVQFDRNMELPITLDYKTPETLGQDRICNVVGAWNENPKGNSLVIDVGTCIKLDIVSEKGTYKGGSISPGLRLRYQSLNDYTANLPLLNETKKTDLIGKSTTEAIHSGVINGMTAEINGLIAQYEEKFGSLTIFVTGGDAKYFDLESKNNIFANKNLTLEGLYQIYLFNAQ